MAREALQKTDLGEYEEIELHGHRVGFQAAGDGDQLIILLHGITSTAEAWRKVMPRLAERYTVIAPDLIGHGRSAKPRGDYSLGAYAAGVRDLPVLQGWRYDVFGKDALALVEGKMAFAVKNGRLAMTRVEVAEPEAPAEAAE